MDRRWFASKGRAQRSYGICYLPLLALAGVVLYIVSGVSAAQDHGAPLSKASPRHDELLLPDRKGAEMTRQLCGSCHSVATFTGLRRSRDRWETVVSDMVTRGALIRRDESGVIVDYLADVFGSTSPPLLDANVASEEDLQRLPGLDAGAVQKLVKYRKANRLKDITQVKDVLGAVTFKKAQGYLTVK